MPAERYFSPHNLDVGMPIILEGGEHHHLLHVMRTAVGDQVEIINGKGILALAEVTASNKRESQLKILDIQKVPPPDFEVILAQALPRLNRLDTIIEKGTELGMTQLWLFAGERSERKELQESQKQRAMQVAVSAMKQCGSLWLPKIEFAQPLKNWKKQTYPLLFGDLAEGADNLWKYLMDHPPEKGVIFVTGPESGFNERERHKLIALGGIGVKLHKNVLRTDTASIAALSLIGGLGF